ncbi:MAG: mitochondrial fission ELM1 family protein [Pseudomonadota bacterium]|nr:mitochondrial fission ELM1 family protein [Pseudomonadota bacterium]
MVTLPGECWVFTDAAAGNQRQALALAEYLQMPIRHLILQPRAPWSWFAPRLILGGAHALHRKHRVLLSPPWPEVAIGCGRSAALFTRMLRRLSEGRCHTVQILDPRIATAHWDTVIAPRHDRVEGPNVLTPLGSLNTIDEAWLADGRQSCPHFAALPPPRVGVLLGGPRQGVPFDSAYARQLTHRLLANQRRDGGSLMVLASRRTPPAVIRIFREAFKDLPGIVWAGPEDGSNPYPAVLGWADRLVVTPDSVNMLSEACAVGCPVQTLVGAPLPAKIRRFHHALRASGRLSDLADEAPPRPQAPLRETCNLAAIVRQRILAQGASRELADADRPAQSNSKPSA